jgi:hypothetical protein
MDELLSLRKESAKVQKEKCKDAKQGVGPGKCGMLFFLLDKKESWARWEWAEPITP